MNVAVELSTNSSMLTLCVCFQTHSAVTSAASNKTLKPHKELLSLAQKLDKLLMFVSKDEDLSSEVPDQTIRAKVS